LKLLFEGLYIRTEEDLMGHKVDNVAHTQHVALGCIEAKLLCKKVKASVVLRGIISDSIAE
jgi:hypothetical protein